MTSKKPFWQVKALEDMTVEEWESLCDGCAKCCLHKIEDIDSGKVYFTSVACRLLDTNTCLCQDYVHRSELVEGCLVLTAALVDKLNWLPASCAYRRLAEGKDLPSWHPLVCGDTKAIHKAGFSIAGRVEREENIPLEDIEDHIVDWLY